MMWLVILLVVVVTVASGTIYMVNSISKIGLIQHIEKKWLRFVTAFSIIAFAFMTIAYLMSVVNAVIISLHFFVFFLISRAVLKCASRLNKNITGTGIQCLLAILTSVLYMSNAYYLCHNVWKTNYELHTDKQVNNLKIVMFADSHISTTFDGEGFAKHMKEIEKQAPDIVFIAGDFVDDWSKRKDMERACEALGSMDIPYGVWYVYGNHDEGFMDSRDFSAQDLENELKRNKVHILEDEVAYIDDICIVGRKDAALGNRNEIFELLDGVDKDKYIIVLDHEPNDYDNESASDADLVLSGHTHGGQLIPINHVAEWLGINDRNYGHENRNGTDFVVTSGIADWAMDFKTGTKSEYVMIRVN